MGGKHRSKIQRKSVRGVQEVAGQEGKKPSGLSISQIVLAAVLVIAVCAAVLAVHWPALASQAELFDDHEYIRVNLLVQKPGWASARRFLTEVLEPSSVDGYYQPLAMISLMADYAMGGRPDNLRVFHRTSLALHTANTALVVLLLYMLFGRIWIATGVGLLFGLHPMTVEPVCWVSDRKTLLAAFFALWCLILYVRFARGSKTAFYVGCLLMYVLALMSKPTSTPLPMVMLLLDFWPLNRLNRRAILEKLPFFAAGAASAIITYISQSAAATAVLPGGHNLARIPVLLCHNIIFYLHKIIWPANLSSHYVLPEPLALSHPMVLAAVIGTCVLVVLLIVSLRWTRAVLTGWLVFFVAILPAMGIVGFTFLTVADKFAYLPSVGLLLVLASLLVWLCSTGKGTAWRAVVVVVVVLTLAGGEAIATRRYLVHWRDTRSLFEYMLRLTPNAVRVLHTLGLASQSEGWHGEAISYHRRALEVEPDYARAHHGLGLALADQGKLDQAIYHYERALRGMPKSASVHFSLGDAFKSKGKLDQAVFHYRRAVQLEPESAKAYVNLGVALAAQGQFGEAERHYRRALQIKPDYAEAYNNLGLALKHQGKLDDAITCYREALRMMPDSVEAHNNLGNALQLKGKSDEAISCYRQAMRLNPNHPAPLNGMAWIFATHPEPNVRQPNEAVRLAERACELTEYQDPAILDTLAAAYAAAGRFNEAETTAQQALALASDAQAVELAAQIRERLELYRQTKPYREPARGQDAAGR